MGKSQGGEVWAAREWYGYLKGSLGFREGEEGKGDCR